MWKGDFFGLIDCFKKGRKQRQLTTNKQTNKHTKIERYLILTEENKAYKETSAKEVKSATEQS